ncbi:MAG: hypothetical protein JWM41_431 [Gemmatimonadetes bacterium]|nr:hypothetical protein [Gemmatimonadota bacterium]
MHQRLLMAVLAGGLIPPALGAQQIVVGPNVQISAGRARDAHSEPVIASDPNHADRLLAAAHIAYHDTVGTKSIAYVSFDTGKTWSVSLERRDSTITADAAVAYGVDGSAFFATLARWGMFRSRDGGRTWDPPTKTPPAYGWDREYMVADFSPGKYHGRVYMNSTVSVPWVSDSSPAGFGGTQKENAVALFTSTDGGSTYGNPIVRLAPRPEGILGMSNSVVLSDGTLMTLYGHRKPAANAVGGGARGGLAARTPLPAANYWLDVITSTDGGETWNTANRIGDYWMNRPRSEAAVIPDLASDPGSVHFKDRVYVVWSDFRSGRLEIMLSYSSDKGKTWSREQIINDDRASADPLVNGPDNVTPVVAVNKDGVVAVAWYDRRDFEDNISWNIRMRASLDGGETWTPSVKITDKPSLFGGMSETWVAAAGGGGGGGGRGRGGADTARSGGAVVSLAGRLSYANFTFAPGHNGAFTADAAGAFHPAWIDYRNGMAQLWTATVRVTGAVAVNGGGDLAGLSNLSSRVALETISTSYDRQANRVTFRTVLRNLSKTDTVRGPLKTRVLVLTSENAKTIEIANPDNQLRGVGAVWDFTPQLTGGMILPDALSAPKDLVFQLGGMSRFREGTDLRLGFVTMDAKVLGPPIRGRPGGRAVSSGDGTDGKRP